MTDTYDDGLVHSHNWAAEPQAPTGTAKAEGTEIGASMSGHPETESFDDGLVHSHDWARS